MSPDIQFVTYVESSEWLLGEEPSALSFLQKFY